MNVRDEAFLKDRAYYGHVPRHVIFYPDGGRRWTRQTGVPGDERDERSEALAYQIGADKCLDFFKAAFDDHGADLDIASCFLLSPTSFEAQRRTEENLRCILVAITYMAHMLAESSISAHFCAVSRADWEWMAPPQEVADSTVLTEEWARLKNALQILDKKTAERGPQQGLLLINYSGEKEVRGLLEGIIDEKNVVPPIGLLLRTGDGMRISDGPVLGLSRAHCHLIGHMLPDVSREEIEEAMRRYIPPRAQMPEEQTSG